MVTLTYKNSMIRSKLVNGRKLLYADFSDVQKMFKRFRNAGHKFKYIVVSEYGGTHHRPHFHLIFSVPKKPKDTYHDIMNLERYYEKLFRKEWRRNVGSNRVPVYKPLCDFISTWKGRTFDFHYIAPNSTLEGEADVCFYVTKYLLKADKWVDRLKSVLKLNLSQAEFNEVWTFLKPRACVSKGWGDPGSPEVEKHIRKGIDIAIESNSEFPFFISPTVGNTFPLSPYYQRRFLTIDDKFSFFYNAKFQPTADGFRFSDLDNPDKERYQSERLKKIRQLINNRLISNDSIYDFEQLKNMAYEELEDNSSSTPCVPDDWVCDFDN